MARRKRQYGSGCIIRKGKRFAIRWRETVAAPDGTTKKILRYEMLGEIDRKEADSTLRQRIASAERTVTRIASDLTFRAFVDQWLVAVLPIYKGSTRKNHRHILQKHLVPQFGDIAVTNITRQSVQTYIAVLQQQGYAPKTIDHVHDVLSAVFRAAVKWGYVQDSPTVGVDLPPLKTVRPKWALTKSQAVALLEKLPVLPRTMVALALITGLRRGELFALRWRDVTVKSGFSVRQRVYEGEFDTPKTEAGDRGFPLSAVAETLVTKWRDHAKTGKDDDLVFATRSGKPISPNNVLRRWVYPACDELGIQRVNWLTCRRTFTSWGGEKLVPAKVMAQLLGHRHVSTTLDTYAQVIDGSLERAVESIGAELFTIVQ